MRTDQRGLCHQHLPVIAETDLLVVGCGPGGLGAAVTAARHGVKVIVAEQYGGAGGMSVYGLVSPMMGNHHDGHPMDRPVYLEWVHRMWEYRTAAMHRSLGEGETFNPAIDPPQRLISKEISMLVMEEMLQEAGVSLLYHHTLTGVCMTGRKIQSAIFHSKSGFGQIIAKQFIDSTGDGDLAAVAGCEFELGNKEGNCQPMTLCFDLGGVDLKRIPDREEINRLYNQARKKDQIHCLRENILIFSALAENTLHFNTTRIIHHSGISGKDLSDAEIEGRRQIRELYRFFRTTIPGFENSYLSSIATQIGVRESRRISGRIYQTQEDFLEQKHYPDGIARMRYMMDIHNPDGSGTEIRCMPPETWYEIRYGTLLPKDCDNLIMGCRAISVSHELHSSVRVMPQVCSLGQAAGMAAALALRNGRNVCEIKGEEVRSALRNFGADL